MTKPVRVFVSICQLSFILLVALSAMVVMEGHPEIIGDKVIYKSMNGITIGTIFMNIAPIIWLTISGICFIAFILQFKLPKLSGFVSIICALLYLLLNTMMGVNFQESTMVISAITFIYFGFFTILICGNFTEIIGRKKMTDAEIEEACKRGYSLVQYEFAFSILVVSFSKNSPVHLVSNKELKNRAIFYSVISLVFGIWGFPWGPIYSYQAIKNNLQKIKDIK